jgi:uncharacterized protein
MTGSSHQRLRALHPLIDPDGSCRIIYDLERTMIFTVPEALQKALAVEIDQREKSSAVTKWLREYDLFTDEQKRSWSDHPDTPFPGVSDLSLDMSGSCNMGCTYCFEKPIHSRIGAMAEETVMASVDFFFRQNAAACRVALHFGSGEPLIQFELLKKIVAAAEGRAAISGQKLGFDLTTNATLVTEERTIFLREHGFNVRVSCDGPRRIHNRFRPMLGGGDSYEASGQL